ncbi:MAG: hypothetical protein KAX80_07710 [Planctomycetes bacterium]|nr:hypothetical protein [Planctomycetota bacterium]
MSPTRAQNAVRRHWGIGKGALHRRMVAARKRLVVFWEYAIWQGVVDADMLAEALLDVEGLAADSIIAADYRDVEKKDYQGPFSTGEWG